MINNAKQGGFYVSIFRDEAPEFYQVFRFFVVIAASIFYAWNLRCFAKTAGLFPGGFSGLSLLLQEIGRSFSGLVFHIPY